MAERDTLYIFGAGLNGDLRGTNGQLVPLSGDFFRVAFAQKQYVTPSYLESLKPVLEFLQHEFEPAYAFQDLKTRTLDLEKIHTAIIDKHARATTPEERARLESVRIRLIWFVAEVLSDFRSVGFTAGTLHVLAQEVLERGMAVATFNYDLIFEHALEIASPRVETARQQQLTELLREYFSDGAAFGDLPSRYAPLIDFQERAWSPIRNYCVPFARLELPIPGPPPMVDGEAFRGGQTREGRVELPLLKLHGSLNWFTFTATPLVPEGHGLTLPETGLRAGDVLLKHELYMSFVPQQVDGRVIAPILVPADPEHVKKQLEVTPPLPELWARFEALLASAPRVVVVGYSWRDKQFRRLTKRILAQSPGKDLVIIRRTRKSRCWIARNIGRVASSIWYQDLTAYLSVTRPIEMMSQTSFERLRQRLPPSPDEPIGTLRCKTCSKVWSIPLGLVVSRPPDVIVSVCPSGHRCEFRIDEVSCASPLWREAITSRRPGPGSTYLGSAR